MIEEFKNWLNDEINNDRIDLTINEKDRIINKLTELIKDYDSHIKIGCKKCGVLKTVKVIDWDCDVIFTCDICTNQEFKRLR